MATNTKLKTSATSITAKAKAKSTKKTTSSKASIAQDRMVRLLMTLEECEGETVRKGAVTKRLPRRSKQESVTTYAKEMEGLKDAKAFSEEKGVLTLEQGVISDRLLAELTQSDFTFQGLLGMGKANVLLKVIRKLAIAPSIEINGNGNGNSNSQGSATILEPIVTYDEFKTVVLEAFDQLKRDYNFERLVPIYRIRREIGERVSRTQFSKWLFEMQAEDILELLEQSVEDGAPDKIEDSVTTSMGKLRCYAKRLDV